MLLTGTHKTTTEVVRDLSRQHSTDFNCQCTASLCASNIMRFESCSSEHAVYCYMIFLIVFAQIGLFFLFFIIFFVSSMVPWVWSHFLHDRCPFCCVQSFCCVVFFHWLFIFFHLLGYNTVEYILLGLLHKVPGTELLIVWTFHKFT